MLRIATFATLAAMLALVADGAAAATTTTAATTAAAPAVRKIPGINATDTFPGACVDCHVLKPPGATLDSRLGTQMKAWMSGKVDAALLAKVQGSAPAGLKLKGRHPAAADALEDIPAACAECHSEDSKKAPPLAAMVHRIHLVGAEKNRFLTVYQGECTHCHKLNATTGAWSVPSGPEK
jgi:hypothetical protein